MSGVAISGTARSAISYLKDIAGEMAAAQKRLSTGKRVNEAGDDPAAFFRAAGLSGRASSLLSLNDRLSSASSAFGAADKGIKSVRSLIETAQSLGRQALQVQNTLARATGTNTTRLTTGSAITGTGRLAAGNTVTVSDGTTTATYTAAAGDSVQTFLTAVNGVAGLQVAASLNSAGQVELQAKGTNNVTVAGTAPNLNASLGLTAGTTTFTASSGRQSLAQQFDALRAQIDQTISDSGFEGVNLLSNDTLSLAFNEKGTSQFSVAGVSLSASGLGLASATAASGGGFQTDADINASLGQLTAALTSLSTQSAVLSSNSSILQNRRDFNSSLIDTLRRGADELVANDPNEDAALLLALQTRQQLATSALSFAGQSSSPALRLLGIG